MTVAVGDRVRCSAETRASGPNGPSAETIRVNFEGVVSEVRGETVLVRVGRTDVPCRADAVELLVRASIPPERSAGALDAAATLDQFLEDARRIGANLKHL